MVCSSMKMVGKLHSTPTRFRGPSSCGRRLCDEWASSRSPLCSAAVAQVSSFEDLVAYSISQVALDTGESPTPTWGLEASGNYFDALRIQPYLGRYFHASDENGPNSAPYMVLSYAYWHSHFHDDRGVVGRVV